jgi:la-related protein 6
LSADVPIATLATFARLKALTEDTKFIANALRQSKKLAVNEEGTMVRRVDPMPNDEQFNERVVHTVSGHTPTLKGIHQLNLM